MSEWEGEPGCPRLEGEGAALPPRDPATEEGRGWRGASRQLRVKESWGIILCHHSGHQLSPKM